MNTLIFLQFYEFSHSLPSPCPVLKEESLWLISYRKDSTVGIGIVELIKLILSRNSVRDMA